MGDLNFDKYFCPNVLMRIARIMGFAAKAILERVLFTKKINVYSFIAKHARNVSQKPGVPPFLEPNIHAKP